MLAVQHKEWLGGFSLCVSFLGAVLLIGLGLFAPTQIQGLRMKVAYATLPVQKVFHLPAEELNLALKSGSNFFSLLKNAEEAKKQNSVYKEEIGRIDSLEQENAELKKQLHWVGINEAVDGFTTVPLIHADKDLYSHSLLTRIPADVTICIGSPVLDSEGLIGRVSEIEKDMARVILIDDPKSQLPVVFADSQGRALLTGKGFGQVVLQYYTSETPALEGEEIITRSEGYMPGQIPVGRVHLNNNVPEILLDGRLEHITMLRVMRNGTLPSESTCRGPGVKVKSHSKA